MSKGQLLTDDQGQELLKGGFRGAQAEGGGYVQSNTVSSDSRLEIGHAVV